MKRFLCKVWKENDDEVINNSRFYGLLSLVGCILI